MFDERIKKVHRLLAAKYPAHCLTRGPYIGTNPAANGILKVRSDESAMTPSERAAKIYHDELMALPKEKLDERIAEADRLAEEARQAAHPFNAPTVRADRNVYDYWVKAAYWRLEEAVALSMGRDPSKVIKRIKRGYEIGPKFYPDTCGPEFEARYELAKRAVAYQQIYEQTIPSIFIAWSQRNRLSVPQELIEAMDAHGIQVADWKVLYDRQVEQCRALESRIAELQAAQGQGERTRTTTASAATRERNTLLKLVLGFAMDCYGYQPNAPRSSTASEISSALQLRGISISEDTVRKYLGEAVEFAPTDDV